MKCFFQKRTSVKQALSAILGAAILSTLFAPVNAALVLTYNPSNKVTGFAGMEIAGKSYAGSFSDAYLSYNQVFSQQIPTFFGQETLAINAVSKLNDLLNTNQKVPTDLAPFQYLDASKAGVLLVPWQFVPQPVPPLWVNTKTASYNPTSPQPAWNDPGGAYLHVDSVGPQTSWVTFASSPIFYSEQGDAGDLANPQAITGLVTGIAGSLGGADLVDSFLFHWSSASDMSIDYFGDFSPAPIYVSLYADPVSTALYSRTILSDTDKFTFSNVLPGDYILKIASSSTIDPDWRMVFSQPISAATPEPATTTLVSFGITGLLVCLRRKAKAR